MNENDAMTAIENMKKMSCVSERIMKYRIKNARVENGVNITRMRRDWIDIVKRLIKDGDYDIRREKIFPYLLSDIEKIPEDFGDEMDTIGAITVNLRKFKKSFSDGWEDLLDQVSDTEKEKKNDENFDPVKKNIRECVCSLEDLSFSEKYFVQFEVMKKIMSYFGVNEGDTLPYIEVLDISMSEDDNMKKVSLSLKSKDDESQNIQIGFTVHP